MAEVRPIGRSTTAELVRSGILEEGPRDRSRITSYLGRAKAIFDNVRGEGYGLREWRTPTSG